ncbi:MAG: hypothetical protein JRN46_01685 [Nitrososphaerota archaeon]|nr:hypothetical protein [Nitrososphaerota archaeon]
MLVATTPATAARNRTTYADARWDSEGLAPIPKAEKDITESNSSVRLRSVPISLQHLLGRT